jgi:uncharacterized membrane protein
VIKELLQGKWFGHPLHPVIVSVPLGLWPLSFVLDVCSATSRSGQIAVTASFYALLVGLLGALGAVATGLADFSEIKPDKPARAIGWRHMLLNATGAVLWTISLVLHRHAWDGGMERATTLSIIVSGIALILSASAAYLGGRMVYDQGIGIARFSKHELRDVAEAAGSRVPRQEGGQ